jgi:hypothetical protein
VFGSSAGKIGRNPRVPPFVSDMIEKGLSTDMTAVESFQAIFETLKWNDFRIMEGIDLDEVTKFVDWIKWSEQLTE